MGSGDIYLITLQGEFEYSDIEQFQTKTSTTSKAIVMLGSNGGNLAAGIQIGTAIRLKGFSTYVPDGVDCASACALAWLGGAKRLMGKTARIGFHAASVDKDGVREQTSIGNALIGAYLNRIGLSDNAIVYITQPSPDEIRWLTKADAEKIGIEVELFSPTEGQTSGLARPPVLDAEEEKRAASLARNFLTQVGAAGFDGLRDSIRQCYDRARDNREFRAVEYCIALDFLTSFVDLTMARKAKRAPTEFYARSRADIRANALAADAGFGDGARDLLVRAEAVANRAAIELGGGPPVASPSSDAGQRPSLFGLRIGDPLSSVSRIGRAPDSQSQSGQYVVLKWVFANGDLLIVWGSPNDSIVYVESDWNQARPSEPSDFSSLTFGRTTLNDLRRRFGSDGFAFARHGGIVKVSDGVVVINSYEAGSTVATFVTKAPSRAIGSGAEIASAAVLAAMSIAAPEYANSEWGARAYDSKYHPIEWN